MNLRDDILAHLETRGPFAAGIELLRQTGFSSFTLAMLARAENAYTSGRVETELTTWLSQWVPEAVTKLDTGSVELVSNNAVDQSDKVAPIKKTIATLLNEQTELKAVLRAWYGMETDAEQRRIMALRIKSISREVSEHYSTIEFLNQYGYMPIPVSVQSDDRALLLNYRTYVSHYKRKVDTAKTDQGKQNARALLKQYRAEVKRLEDKLHNQI